MKLIGLTGTIASGKSTVAKILSHQPNTGIIYTDLIAREALDIGTPALQRVIDAFGEDYLLPDGSLDRKKLGNLIFSNIEAKKQLEDITHPAIAELLMQQISILSNKDFIVIENAILFESGQHHMMDAILIVTVDPQIQKIRLMKRNDLTSEEADIRIVAQMSADLKIEWAHKSNKPFELVENNSNDIFLLEEDVIGAWENLTRNL